MVETLFIFKIYEGKNKQYFISKSCCSVASQMEGYACENICKITLILRLKGYRARKKFKKELAAFRMKALEYDFIGYLLT